MSVDERWAIAMFDCESTHFGGTQIGKISKIGIGMHNLVMAKAKCSPRTNKLLVCYSDKIRGFIGSPFFVLGYRL